MANGGAVLTNRFTSFSVARNDDGVSKQKIIGAIFPSRRQTRQETPPDQLQTK